MFENILHQRACVQLRRDFRSRSLPPSILFAGPAASGKGSTALELARVLSCEKRGAWTCGCPSCERHRALIHPDLMILGNRAFLPEIACAARALTRESSSAPLGNFFIRAVRKLLARFAPAIWEDDMAKLNKLASPLSALEEELEELESLLIAIRTPSANGSAAGSAAGSAKDPEAALAKLLSSIEKNAAKLEADGMGELVPVDHLRRAAYWSRLAPSGRRKVLLLENAERMNDAGRNSLLKILEEPPPAVTIILSTARPRALLPTILSRLRPYRFAARTPQEEAEVIRRVFHDSAAAAALPGGAGALSNAASTVPDAVFDAVPEKLVEKKPAPKPKVGVKTAVKPPAKALTDGKVLKEDKASKTGEEKSAAGKADDKAELEKAGKGKGGKNAAGKGKAKGKAQAAAPSNELSLFDEPSLFNEPEPATTAAGGLFPMDGAPNDDAVSASEASSNAAEAEASEAEALRGGEAPMEDSSESVAAESAEQVSSEAESGADLSNENAEEDAFDGEFAEEDSAEDSDTARPPAFAVSHIERYLDSFLPVPPDSLVALAALTAASIARIALRERERCGLSLPAELSLLAAYSAPRAEAAGLAPCADLRTLVPAILDGAARFEMRALFPRFVTGILSCVSASLRTSADADNAANGEANGEAENSAPFPEPPPDLAFPRYRDIWREKSAWAVEACGIWNLSPQTVLDRYCYSLTAAFSA